jgi:hypothetical protein
VETATLTVLVEPVVSVKPMVRKSGQDWQAHQLDGQTACYPIGDVLLKVKVAAAIAYGHHGTTYGRDLFVCQAEITVFDKFCKPSFLAEVSNRGENFKQLLRTMLSGNPHLKEVQIIYVPECGSLFRISSEPNNFMLDLCSKSKRFIGHSCCHQKYKKVSSSL